MGSDPHCELRAQIARGARRGKVEGHSSRNLAALADGQYRSKWVLRSADAEELREIRNELVSQTSKRATLQAPRSSDPPGGGRIGRRPG